MLPGSSHWLLLQAVRRHQQHWFSARPPTHLALMRGKGWGSRCWCRAARHPAGLHACGPSPARAEARWRPGHSPQTPAGRPGTRAARRWAWGGAGSSLPSTRGQRARASLAAVPRPLIVAFTAHCGQPGARRRVDARSVVGCKPWSTAQGLPGCRDEAYEYIRGAGSPGNGGSLNPALLPLLGCLN